mgnify:CR=1 FL=1
MSFAETVDDAPKMVLLDDELVIQPVKSDSDKVEVLTVTLPAAQANEPASR